MDDPSTGAPACPHTSAWLAAEPRLPGSVNPEIVQTIGESLMGAGAAYARVDCPREFRAALIKVLAATVAAPMADITEDQAFKLSQELREALYLEILRFRRAAQLDHDAGAFDA